MPVPPAVTAELSMTAETWFASVLVTIVPPMPRYPPTAPVPPSAVMSPSQRARTSTVPLATTVLVSIRASTVLPIVWMAIVPATPAIIPPAPPAATASIVPEPRAWTTTFPADAVTELLSTWAVTRLPITL